MTVSDRLRSVLPGFDDPSSGDAVEPPDGAPWWRGAIVGVLTGLTSLAVVVALFAPTRHAETRRRREVDGGHNTVQRRQHHRIDDHELLPGSVKRALDR